MRIKFKAPDPRAGSYATMDSSRGQHFIDAGAADAVAESEGPAPAAAGPVQPITATPAAPPADPPSPAETLVSGKAADVIAALPAVTDVDLLKAALVAEQAKADKARATVVTALQAAIATADKAGD